MTLLELILRERPVNGETGKHPHQCGCTRCRAQKRQAPPVPMGTSTHRYWRDRRKARLGYELPGGLPGAEGELWIRRIRLPLKPGKKYRALNDLKRFRGKTFIDTPLKKFTIARLSIPGQPVHYGVSAHGQAMHLRSNAITRSHAEGDVFNQASRHGPTSTFGQLVVDRPFCKACGEKSGVLSLARQVGLRVLDVIQPHLPYRERIYLK